MTPLQGVLVGLALAAVAVVAWLLARRFTRKPDPVVEPQLPGPADPIPDPAEVQRREERDRDLANDTSGDPGGWASDRYRRPGG